MAARDGSRHRSLCAQQASAVIETRQLGVPAGKGRGSAAEFAHFLNIALGSLREVETLLCLADRLGLVKKETLLELQRQADEVGKVLFGLCRAARNSKADARRPKPKSDS